MKVTDEMVTAYAVAFDTAKGRTTERRRKAIQAVLDLGLGEMTKTTIDTLTQEVGRLNLINGELGQEWAKTQDELKAAEEELRAIRGVNHLIGQKSLGLERWTESARARISAMEEEISYLREIVSRYEPERSFDYDYPDPAAAEGRT